MPILVELINRFASGSKLKFIVSLLLPLVAGAAINYNQLSIDNVEAILASGSIMFLAAQGVYKLYFRDSKLQKRLAK